MEAVRFATGGALLALALGCPIAVAQSLYKLVDRHGKVTYSDSVPRGFEGRVVPMLIDAGQPSPGTDGSGESAGRSETATGRDVRRRPADYENALEAARRKARDARKAYEDARDNSTAEDWVYVNPDRNPVGVRRFPKPAYAARLEELERRAVLAERELEKLERDRRLYP